MRRKNSQSKLKFGNKATTYICNKSRIIVTIVARLYCAERLGTASIGHKSRKRSSTHLKREAGEGETEAEREKRGDQDGEEHVTTSSGQSEAVTAQPPRALRASYSFRFTDHVIPHHLYTNTIATIFYIFSNQGKISWIEFIFLITSEDS